MKSKTDLAHAHYLQLELQYEELIRHFQSLKVTDTPLIGTFISRIADNNSLKEFARSAAIRCIEKWKVNKQLTEGDITEIIREVMAIEVGVFISTIVRHGIGELEKSLKEEPSPNTGSGNKMVN